MAEHDFASESVEEARRARKQLFVKGIIATVAVAVLVVALVMVEGKHEEEEPAPTARTVTPIGTTREPEAQSMSLAEAATQALRNSSEAAELQSVVMAEQQAVASAAAAAPVVPEETTDPLGVPAPASMPHATATNRRESAGRLVLEQSPPKSPRISAASSAAVSTAKPVTAAVAKAPAAGSAIAPGDFFVQVGVFSNPGNAEELRGKLKAAGIPTQVETRVQVGPFSNRQEALAAQAKLKALGMDGGMVVTGRH